MNYISIQPLIRYRKISSFTFSELWGIADHHRKVGIEEVYARLNKDKTIIKNQWACICMSIVGIFLNLFVCKYLGILPGTVIAALLVFVMYILGIQIVNLKANIRDYTCIICNIVSPMVCEDKKMIQSFAKACELEEKRYKEERKKIDRLVKKHTKEKYENILN